MQALLGYGTAYRLTKRGGDDGVALFGWLFVMNLAAMIPGLGYWLWVNNRDEVDYQGRPIQRPAPKPPTSTVKRPPDLDQPLWTYLPEKEEGQQEETGL